MLKIKSAEVKSYNKKIKDTLEYFIESDRLCRTTGEADVKCDRINLNKFLNFIKDNNVPDFNVYGDIYSDIFLHVYEKKLIRKYKKVLLSQIKKGYLYPFYYAMMIDRNKFDHGKPTVYNTYGGSFNLKIENRKIRKNRKQIGLSIYIEGPNINP